MNRNPIHGSVTMYCGFEASGSIFRRTDPTWTRTASFDVAGRALPDRGDDLVERDRTSGVASQQLEDRELGRRQLDLAGALDDLALLDVDRQAGNSKRSFVASCRRGAAAHERGRAARASRTASST